MTLAQGHIGVVFSMTDKERDSENRATWVDADQTHSEDGVDLTLIRWMLSLTPAERLSTLQNTIRSFKRLADVVNEP